MSDEMHIKAILRTTENSKSLSSLGLLEKNIMLKTISGYYHDSTIEDTMIHLYTRPGVIPSQIFFYDNKVGHIFVPKSYHDKRDTNFLNFFPTWVNMGQIVHVANFHKFPQGSTSIRKKKLLRH